MFLKKIKKTIIKKLRDFFAKSNYPEVFKDKKGGFGDDQHLKETIQWLVTAQDITSCGGVSASFDISNKKWGKAYRETTGYIIETFINYFQLTKDKAYLKRAEEMGSWELSVQCEDGAFGEQKKDKTIGKKIFNTGQIIIGLISLYRETKKDKYLVSARKAGDWLISQQEDDGSWAKFTTQGPKTYHSRVAWSLILLQKESGDDKYLKAGLKNINWVVKQQEKNFWFSNTSLSIDDSPWTHLIAYTISGLIETYVLLDKKDQNIFESFYGSADTLLKIFMNNSSMYLPCSFNKNWESKDKYSCLTGNAQLAIVWMQIFELTKEKKFLDGAFKIIEQIKKTQILETEKAEIRGGVFGSFPVDGDYAPFMIINWATKFFVDALLLKKKYI